jgi:hypothetical protein
MAQLADMILLVLIQLAFNRTIPYGLVACTAYGVERTVWVGAMDEV